MNVQFPELPGQDSSVHAKTAIADCDIHPARDQDRMAIPMSPSAGTIISKPTMRIPIKG